MMNRCVPKNTSINVINVRISSINEENQKKHFEFLTYTYLLSFTKNIVFRLAVNESYLLYILIYLNVHCN